jgi:hypothetical protein
VQSPVLDAANTKKADPATAAVATLPAAL